MNSPSAAGDGPRAIDRVRASLKRRYAAERRFRRLGLAAVLLGLGFVAMLFVSIVGKGWTAFIQTSIALPVQFDAQVIDPEDALADPALTATERQRLLVRVNFLKLARAGLRAEFPDVQGRTRTRALNGLLSPGAPLQLRDLVTADPALIGTEQTLRLLADDDVDMLMKGHSTAIRSRAGEGIASLTGTTGQVRILTTGNAFADVLADIKARLEGRAEALEREAARLGRERDRLAETHAIALPSSAAVGEDDAEALDADGTLTLSAEAIKARARIVKLDRQIAARRAEAEALQDRARTPGGAEPMTRDMPSWLVSINGGMLRLTRVGNSAAEAEVITPPRDSADAATGSWELVELVLPAADRRLSDEQIAWVWQLDQRGLIAQRFNVNFFSNGSSREPELAGIAGALMGSLYTLALTLLFSFPIAVGAAVYLEEFAPKNRWTDLIEVNINNLAAVPSIVFGLLGLAVFINFFGVPRSTPLVAALVLTLMTLPTIIIASRAALKSVPPSIREAALGVGASPLQTQLHHVLPLALPGMLTGTIIGMAQALGETAPLLMIGMIAFIVDIPGGITDPSTVLPVQIFLWADSPERGFVERTSAAIMVLLGFLILMNLAAVLLRRRFERRW